MRLVSKYLTYFRPISTDLNGLNNETTTLIMVTMRFFIPGNWPEGLNNDSDGLTRGTGGLVASCRFTETVLSISEAWSFQHGMVTTGPLIQINLIKGQYWKMRIPVYEKFHCKML
jgi:hypothetical protein